MLPHVLRLNRGCCFWRCLTGSACPLLESVLGPSSAQMLSFSSFCRSCLNSSMAAQSSPASNTQKVVITAEACVLQMVDMAAHNSQNAAIH